MASVLIQRLSYPTETVLSNKITRNRRALSCKESPRKPFRRRPPLKSKSSRRPLSLPSFSSWISRPNAGTHSRDGDGIVEFLSKGLQSQSHRHHFSAKLLLLFVVERGFGVELWKWICGSIPAKSGLLGISGNATLIFFLEKPLISMDVSDLRRRRDTHPAPKRIEAELRLWSTFTSPIPCPFLPSEQFRHYQPQSGAQLSVWKKPGSAACPMRDSPAPDRRRRMPNGKVIIKSE